MNDYTWFSLVPSPPLSVWFSKFAGKYGLPRTRCCIPPQWPRHQITSTYRLPPSVHVELFERLWRTMDVFLDKLEQKPLATGSQILYQYLLSLLAPFHGRMYLRSKLVGRSTYGTSKLIEHEVYMTGAKILSIVEIERVVDKDDSDVEHLLSSILNDSYSDEHLNTNYRRYGIITHLDRWSFFMHDSAENKFYFIDDLTSQTVQREAFFVMMIEVADRIFTLLLEGYMNVIKIYNRGVPQRPIEATANALVQAMVAKRLMSKPYRDYETLEKRGQDGLCALRQSVLSIHRAYPRYLSYLPEPRSVEELKRRAERYIRCAHENSSDLKSALLFERRLVKLCEQ